MTWYAPLSQTTTFSSANTGDGVFIGPDVQISVAGNYGIHFTSSSHRAIIYGTVVSTTLSGVMFGGPATAADPGHTIDVKPGAVVQSFSISQFAVYAWGVGSTVTNEGTISGLGGGLGLTGQGPTGTVTVINSGTIHGNGTGVDNQGNDRTVLHNSGLISGANWSFNGAVSDDVVNNSGRMVGTISLNAGNDTYNGSAGHVSGTVFGEFGMDTIIGGSDNERFEGGNDNDTLIGNAGVDILLGQAGYDTLNGGLGGDILDGGSEIDTLFGGAGRDYLTGGSSIDFFVFDSALNRITNVDVVMDFSHVDDAIKLENAVFKTLGVGVLKASAFYKGAKAHDSNDRIIYNPKNGAVYYDNDGIGSHAQILFAVLAGTPADITRGDFVVV